MPGEEAMKQRLVLMALFFFFACGVQQAIGQTCTLTITALNFGTYTSTLLNGTATGKVTCAGAWDIPFGTGTGAGATETVRVMTGTGGATLNYQLLPTQHTPTTGATPRVMRIAELATQQSPYMARYQGRSTLLRALTQIQ